MLFAFMYDRLHQGRTLRSVLLRLPNVILLSIDSYVG